MLRAYGLSRLQPINKAADSETETDDDKSDDDDDSGHSSPCIEDIVRETPGFALSRLAGALGLDCENIKKNMELYEDLLEFRALQASRQHPKRIWVGSSQSGQSEKRTKKDTHTAEERSEIPEAVTIAGVQIRVSKSPSSITWPETPDYVTWRDSKSPPRRRLQDAQDVADAKKTSRSSPISHGRKESSTDRPSIPRGSTVPLSDLSSHSGSQGQVTVRQKS